MSSKAIATLFLPGNFVAEVKQFTEAEGFGDGPEEEEEGDKGKEEEARSSSFLGGGSRCKLRVCVHRNSGGVSSLVGSTTLVWNEEHVPPQVKWNSETEMMEFRGDRDVVKLPLSLPTSLACKVGSKKASLSLPSTQASPNNLHQDSANQEQNQNIRDTVDKLCHPKASLQSFQKFLAFMEHIGHEQIDLPASQQKSLLDVCCLERNKRFLAGYIRSGIFRNKAVVEAMVGEIKRAEQPDLWIAYLTSAVNISEHQLVLALMVSLCSPEDEKGEEEWGKVQDVVFQSPFTQEYLVSELRSLLSPTESLKLLKALKSRLVAAFIGNMDSQKLNLMIDWTNTAVDVLGEGLVQDEEFVDEIEEILFFLVDSIHLLNSGLKLENRLDLLKSGREKNNSAASREYSIEKLILS